MSLRRVYARRKGRSNENTYFQQLRRRKSLFQMILISPVFDLTILLSIACSRRGTIHRARLSFSLQPVPSRRFPDRHPTQIPISLPLYVITSRFPQPVSDQSPYTPAKPPAPQSTHPPADNSPPPRSKSAPPPAPTHSTYAQNRSSRRPSA